MRALASGRSFYLDTHTVPIAQVALDDELARNAYDAVFFEGLFVAGYRVPSHVRIVLDEHNIEHELLGGAISVPAVSRDAASTGSSIAA